MKNKFLTAILLVVVAITIASCFASRRQQGCPMNATSSKPFRA